MIDLKNLHHKTEKIYRLGKETKDMKFKEKQKDKTNKAYLMKLPKNID